MSVSSKIRERQYNIFLSHSSQDKWICIRIARLLSDHGIHSHLDAFDFEAGRNIGEEVKKGIRDSNELLVLLSPASIQSDWVKHEAGIADAYDLPITLVLLHVTLDQRPEPLKGLLSISMDELDSFAERLRKKLESDHA